MHAYACLCVFNIFQFCLSHRQRHILWTQKQKPKSSTLFKSLNSLNSLNSTTMARWSRWLALQLVVISDRWFVSYRTPPAIADRPGRPGRPDQSGRSMVHLWICGYLEIPWDFWQSFHISMEFEHVSKDENATGEWNCLLRIHMKLLLESCFQTLSGGPDEK